MSWTIDEGQCIFPSGCACYSAKTRDKWLPQVPPLTEQLIGGTLKLPLTCDEEIFGFKSAALCLAAAEDHDQARTFGPEDGRCVVSAQIGVVLVVGVDHFLAAQVQFQEAVRATAGSPPTKRAKMSKHLNFSKLKFKHFSQLFDFDETVEFQSHFIGMC